MELPIGIDLAGDQGGNDLFVGWAEDPFLFRAVADLEQDVAGGFVAAAFLPDIGWLQGGHEQFQGARAIHFLANNCSTLRRARSPRGRKVYRPPVSLRIRPARSSSLCEMISASAGVSSMG